MPYESYSIQEELPPHWLGNLTGYLAAQQIDIESIQAELFEGYRWRISARLRANYPPSPGEFIAMARLRYDARDLMRGPLERYYLERSGDNLHLILRAEDRLGFLARLCADLAAHALFPVRIDARSDDGWIADNLWLRGIGHAAPHPETEAQLTRFLDSWLAGHLSRHPSLRPPSQP